jgi:hypothetical protein
VVAHFEGDKRIDSLAVYADLEGGGNRLAGAREGGSGWNVRPEICGETAAGGGGGW